MKTNVEYLSKNFFVNEKKKTVVCKLDFCINLDKIPMINNYIDFGPIQDYISTLDHICNINICKQCQCDNCDGCMYNDNNNYQDSSAGIVCFTVYGKSKASGADVFNKTLGEHLSLTRAQKEAFKVAYAFYNNVINILNYYTVNYLFDLKDGCVDSFGKSINHEKELLDKYNV